MHKPNRQLPVRLLAAILPVILTVPASAAHAPDDVKSVIARIENPQSPSRKDLDKLSLPALLKLLNVPGVSVAVVKDFKIHWAKAYGVADAKTQRPLDTRTRFQSASISKPVTALAAMRMVQENRLNLDADINTVLKSWQVPKSDLTRDQAVTARSLLSHTSGADDGFGFPGYDVAASLPTLVQILEGQPPSNVGKVGFARAPYAASKYSGGALVIMQLAMADLCGRPFAVCMQSAVLAPLDMTNSSFEQPTAVGDNPNAALAHDKQGRRIGPPWHRYPEQAAAGLWSTPSDLAKFIIELQTALRDANGKVLDRQSAREMISPVGVGRYSVGLAIDQRGAGWYFSHSGDNWGYKAWISGHVRKGYGLVVMTNGDNGMAVMNEIADRVEKTYDWDSFEEPTGK